MQSARGETYRPFMDLTGARLLLTWPADRRRSSHLHVRKTRVVIVLLLL